MREVKMTKTIRYMMHMTIMKNTCNMEDVSIEGHSVLRDDDGFGIIESEK